MPIARKHYLAISPVSPFLYGVVLLAASWASHFAVLSNDVFPLRWQAEHLSLHNPESFYNGFYPIGYPFLLRLLSFMYDPVRAAMLLQIVLAPWLAYFVYRFLRKSVTESGAVLALAFILFSPQVLRAVLSETPDFLALLFMAWAFTSYSNNEGLHKMGILMGLAYLFRTHVVAFAVPFVVFLLFFRSIQRWKPLFTFCVGFLPFVVLQGAVQLFSGHGFFENAQAFNVWKTMYGMDWNNPPMIGNISAWTLIAKDPAQFFACYAIGLWKSVPYAVPMLGILTLWVVKRNVPDRLVLLSAVSLVYIAITAAGSSPRNMIVVLPIIVTSLFYLVEELFSVLRIRIPLSVAKASSMLLWSTAIVGTIVCSSHAGARVDEYSDVQHALGLEKAQDAIRVYSDDFD